MDADESTEPEAEGWRRWWQTLVRAGGWFADTFRGYSGSQQLKNREK